VIGIGRLDFSFDRGGGRCNDAVRDLSIAVLIEIRTGSKRNRNLIVANQVMSRGK
jgi:hypothetical protein